MMHTDMSGFVVAFDDAAFLAHILIIYPDDAKAGKAPNSAMSPTGRRGFSRVRYINFYYSFFTENNDTRHCQISYD